MKTDAGNWRHSTEFDPQFIPECIPQVLAGFDEPMLLFNSKDEILAWSSPAALRLFELDVDEIGERRIAMDAPTLRPLAACLANKQAKSDLEVAGQRFTCKVTKLTAADTGMDEQTFIWCKTRETDSRNIRQYLEAREQLFTTSRTISVSEMATTLAHELNQPIGSIANILKGTRARLENTDCEESIIDALERATEQTRFASRIITRIRDFTRSRQPVRNNCQVDTLLNDSIALLDWVLDSAGIAVERVFPDMVPVINGDETMLQQVFTNLIRNAVDAMQSVPLAQRQLRIAVSVQNRNVHIDIEDSGPGLSTADEQNLFVPFVTQKAQGMGVGLNICRSFVELHQGRLWLKPNEEGGCTACVVLAAVVTE